ncbi:MAG TPA: UTP--glucose-1-phosphate uridylyltransferase GalU [Ligilactobacillus acidipiscis]|uniref:UTP--glucose-1-phosphate uridylyltransferase n=2 Tax=Ligilactobacillus acidipiscis TaxID=89059 RepID=A0A921F9V5_9LACO|nr:UTP--glucose-1-phosphate uridylyltransferase GalU [Ligilactobacillus acidipiscis]
MKVRKAVIPAAGLGTRFLPATKAMPKEMLPIIDRPTIEFIVKEAIDSGIEDILIVTGKGKQPIENHFDSNPELEANLKEKGKSHLLKLVQETTNINLFFIRQPHPNGLGDAVLRARDFIDNEPFVVMLGDDLMRDKVPLTKQLIDRYDKTHASTLAVMRVPHAKTKDYGIIEPISELDHGLYDVKSFVEKPAPKDAPSELAIIGRYLLTPEIFDLLETQKPGKDHEIQLTDAIDRLNATQRVFAHEFTGERFDVGNKFGYLKTAIQFGLENPEIKDDLTKYLKEVGKRLEPKPQQKK